MALHFFFRILKIFTTRQELSAYVSEQKEKGSSVGFVPTMGALHRGHLSLIDAAGSQTDLVVVSIFVNPTQFNDKKDLERYPRPVNADLEKLKTVKCDILFMPGVTEMYSGDEQWNPDLDGLDTVLEGEKRAGHYKGVTQIVKKLLDVVKPDKAFFGQKDFQQFLIISKMVAKSGLGTELVMCPIIREDDGLAMSSRNVHLSAGEHQTALALWLVLQKTKREFENKTIAELRADALQILNSTPGLTTDYFEICDSRSLEPVATKDTPGIIALVAAQVGSTRLIDNIILR